MQIGEQASKGLAVDEFRRSNHKSDPCRSEAAHHLRQTLIEFVAVALRHGWAVRQEPDVACSHEPVQSRNIDFDWNPDSTNQRLEAANLTRRVRGTAAADDRRTAVVSWRQT